MPKPISNLGQFAEFWRIKNGDQDYSSANVYGTAESPPSLQEPVPARDLTVAAPAAAPPKPEDRAGPPCSALSRICMDLLFQPEEPALPKGPPRPAGVSTTDDLFFSDGE